MPRADVDTSTKKVGCRLYARPGTIAEQMECLLEMRIKLSIVVSNLLGASGIRTLRALTEGETFVVIVLSS